MNPRNIHSRALLISGRIVDSPRADARPALIESTRRKSLAHLLFVLLGVAVILWGIQYKLSLYRSVAVQRAIPVAKLLSQKERLSTSIVKEFSVAPTDLPFATRTRIALPFSARVALGSGASGGLGRQSFLASSRRGISPATPFRRASPRAPPVAA